MEKMTDNNINLALPKGALLDATAALIDRAGWGVQGYSNDARYYRLQSDTFPGLRAKILNERDIPVQVAIGNYELGITGLDWVEELLVKYPALALVRILDLGYGARTLEVGINPALGVKRVGALTDIDGVIRIASEYPNIAEAFAVEARLRRFRIFPVYGAPGAYPPEHAELAVIRGSAADVAAQGMLPLGTIFGGGACLIANRDAWQTRDLSALLAPLGTAMSTVAEAKAEPVNAPVSVTGVTPMPAETLRLALPDGHQQAHVVKLLAKAGIGVSDYPSETGNRRPGVDIPGVSIKVIRPQDMPQQVATGNFDLAITGQDWLKDHLYQFPESPVAELLDLKYGWVRIVAVVSEDTPAESVEQLKEVIRERNRPLRVASEYINIADRYAQSQRLGEYRIIPTYGATEAFLPEDADILIENTETGGTIRRHNLKIIDTLFESTACLVGNLARVREPGLAPQVERIVTALKKGLTEEVAPA
jgi:ATP phosphoribosyltransferase